MPRPLRVHVPGGFYHVTLRGNHRQALFVHDGDQRLLNRIVARALQTFNSKVHAYCWMTNHLHLLMQVEHVPLGNPMRNIAAEFARAMQAKLDTTGHLFERRYHARLVDADDYFMELLRYIHLNPVRAGLVTCADQYRWSSHHAYVGSRQEPWVATDFGLRFFGTERAQAVTNYRRFLEAEDAASWTPDEMLKSTEPELAAPEPFELRAVPPTRPGQSLDQLIGEACALFGVTPQCLRSPVRNSYMGKVRAWIAHQALNRQICGLTMVARALQRDESTLRYSMRAHANDLL